MNCCRDGYPCHSRSGWRWHGNREIDAGLNVRFMAQVPSAATVDPLVHVVPVVAMAKSAAFVPLIASVARCSVEPPGLVSVISVAALVVPTP